MRQKKVVLTPIERKAEFVKRAMINKKLLNDAAKQDLDTSWTHLRECFAEVRNPSKELAARVARYVGIRPSRFWGALPFAEV